MENIKKINNSQYELEITLKGKEIEKYLDLALKDEMKKVKAPGFRPGKMPKSVFIKKYGMQSVYPTAVDMIINDVYPKVVTENKLQVVSHPEFDWTTLKISEKDGFYIKGTIEVLPEIELPDLDKLKAKVKKKDVKVSKKEIKTEIDNMLAKDATYETTKAMAKLGDITIIDFEGFLDGKAFDGGSGEDYSLTLGSGSFIEGFEDQLVGHKAGEKLDINVTFPKGYPAEELEGKDVVFKCHIKEVKKRTLPKLTAKKIESLEGFDVKTKEELESKIEENLKERKEATNKAEYEREVLEAIVKATDLKVPEAFITEETQNTINNLEATYKQQGFSLDMYLQMVGMDLETLKKQLNKESELRVASQLIIESYLKDNKVKVTKKEITDETKQLMKAYDITEEELVKRIGEDKAPLVRDLEYRKVHELIFS